MTNQKTLMDEKQRKELAEAELDVNKDLNERINGDFQDLMKKDVVLNDKIQEVLTRDGGRCDKLSADQQAEYKKWLCAQIGVSPTLQPIDLIPTKNGLRPYLNKGAAERIRDERKISITDIEVTEQNGMYVVLCKVRDANGRIDCDMGAVNKGDEPNNALMKAVTKAKRRATLSMCGLGAIIEEAHPTEYNGNGEPEECKSKILLEDEKATKTLFFDVVNSKIGEDTLKPELLRGLLEQAQRLANTDSTDDAARWLQEHGTISLKKDGDGNVVKATIKEVKHDPAKG